jgi:hypothetical protein
LPDALASQRLRRRPAETEIEDKRVALAVAFLRQLGYGAYANQRLPLDRNEERTDVVTSQQDEPIADDDAD